MFKMVIQKQNLDCDRKRRIFIVGDHPVARQGLTTLINQQTDLFVCGEAENAQDALELIEALMPDMAIIDISNKGFSGISLVRNISKWILCCPHLKKTLIHAKYINPVRPLCAIAICNQSS